MRMTIFLCSLITYCCLATACRDPWVNCDAQMTAESLDNLLKNAKHPISPFFSGTRSGLKVASKTREAIQNLKQQLLALSKKEDYYGREVCLTRNECHGASRYLKRVLKDSLGLDTVMVTFEPRSVNAGGFEHSFLIVPNYFGENSPLVIDPSMKQFMPEQNWVTSHDIFIGSPEEYLKYIRQNGVQRSGDSPDTTFLHLMTAVDTRRFE